MKQKAGENTETITGFFEADHREIDAIFEGVDFSSPLMRLVRFQEFDARLERHIRWEEEILFPALELAAPDFYLAPLRVMKMEHRRVREYKSRALAALGEGDGNRALDEAREMRRILADHNAKEEEILYPACDQALAPEAAREILGRLQKRAAGLRRG